MKNETLRVIMSLLLIIQLFLAGSILFGAVWLMPYFIGYSVLCFLFAVFGGIHALYEK